VIFGLAFTFIKAFSFTLIAINYHSFWYAISQDVTNKNGLSNPFLVLWLGSVAWAILAIVQLVALYFLNKFGQYLTSADEQNGVQSYE
jgi:hypothetical protein